VKQRTCKECKRKFTPDSNMFLPPTCEKMKCKIDYANKHLNKKAKEKKQVARKAIKQFNNSDKIVLKRNAQMLINKYARLRDQLENGYRCCTCPHTTGQMDGGHFLPTSGYSAIRYNINQIHQQCKRCNRFNGGMPKEYRVFMINKYGLEYVEKLESTKGELRSYSVEFYQRIIKILRVKIRKLEPKIKEFS